MSFSIACVSEGMGGMHRCVNGCMCCVYTVHACIEVYSVYALNLCMFVCMH